MMFLHTIILVLGFSAASASLAEETTSRIPLPLILPQPVRCHMADGEFFFNNHVKIVAQPALEKISRLAAEQLGVTAELGEGKTAADHTISLALDATLPTEGYQLDIAPKRITIGGGSPSGIFHGVQTLRQLLGPAQLHSSSPLLSKGEESIKIPCLAIEDHPRFVWRGLMLDCSRTFQSPDYLKKTIERLAFYKMNVLHLHLTDDQGWRMEIRKHPELTQKGAKFSAKYNEPESHQGFYTRAELKELVEYAQLRGVILVPEIEMPGHCWAALVCHPELSCTGKISDDIFPFDKGANITEDVYCAGDDAVFTFLQDVLDEVIEIFPSKYIHIGGDEVPKTRWKTCPKCQTRIETEGLNNEHELQSYFIRRIERYLTSKGRRLIGWDEILEGGLAPNAAVMSWRGVNGGILAAKNGHEVVMSPTSHCYFDYPYKSIDSRRAYTFDPVAGLSSEHANLVLGLQANFWSHIDREPPQVDNQIFPRLLALAERAWSPNTATDWNKYEPRLQAQLPWLSEFGIQYRLDPVGKWTASQMTEAFKLMTWDITKQVVGPGRYRVTFRYTDGTCRLGIELARWKIDRRRSSSRRHRFQPRGQFLCFRAEKYPSNRSLRNPCFHPQRRRH